MLTITRLRDKFEIHATVCDVHKGRSGRPRTTTSDESTTAVLELFQRSPQKSSRQAARESDGKASFVCTFQGWCNNLVTTIQIEAYWAEDNPCITVKKAVNLPGVNVWCGLSARGLIGPFRFEETVNEKTYLIMLAGSIFIAIRASYGNDEFYFQQDGAPPLYHRDVRAYLDHNVPGQWIERRGPIEFHERSPVLTPLDFFLWGTVKDNVYKRKPRLLDTLWNEIQAVCAEILVETLVRYTESMLTRTQQCIDAEGHQI
ncbi:Protein of unknown function DUF4817 [Biomphalaria glabrata]|nr:Protein of unknown function DUF4817 [Biomphalaria glabrata]